MLSRGTRRESGVDGFFFWTEKKRNITTGERVQGWCVQKARKNNPQVNKFYDEIINENKVARRRVPLRLHILLLKIRRDHHRSVQQATTATAATAAATLYSRSSSLRGRETTARASALA